MQAPTLDYRRFAIFSSFKTVWKIEKNLIQKFNEVYDYVLAGNPIDFEDVVAPLERIFENLEYQSTSEIERSFLTELKALVVSRLSDEHTFYNSLSSEQLNNYRALPDQVILVRRFSVFTTAIIKLICLQKIRRLNSRAQKGMNNREDLTYDQGLFSVLLRSVLWVLFRCNGVIAELKKSWGNQVGVIGVGLELSVPDASWWRHPDGTAGNVGITYAHVDEAKELPKAIVYLNQVQVGNGATEFFPGIYSLCNFSPLQQLIGRVVGSTGALPQSSLHNHFRQYGPNRFSKAFREMFMRLPEELRHNSHFGWDVPADDEFSQWVLEQRFRLIGPAGTYVVFDGARTLHRGGLATQGNRLVLQVVFGSFRLNEELSKINRFVKLTPKQPA